MRWGVALGVTLLAASAHAEPIEVTVRGDELAGPPVSRRDPTAASTVVEKKELRAPGATSADLLGRVPGVVTTRTGAASDLATASIRGATSSQIPVYLAGIRLNDDVTGTADLSTVPLWILSRVEVFRGNAPAQADRAGLGGAVLFEPELPGRSRVRAGASVGSFGSRAAWVGATLANSRSAALVAVRRELATNDYPYRDDGGTRFDSSDDRVRKRVNADFSAWDAWAIGRHRLGRSARILTLLNIFDREQGVTGLSVLPARHARSHVRRTLAAVSATAPCRTATSAGERCLLELGTSWIGAETTLRDPRGELALGAREASSVGQRVQSTARLSTHPNPWLRLGVGLDPASEWLSLERPSSRRLAQRQSARSSATVSVTPVERWEVFALASGELHQTSAAGEDRGLFEPAGRLGTRVRLAEQLFVLGNLGHYARVPTLGELYGISPLVLGSSDLRPETGETVDIGLRWGLGESSPRGGFWVDAFGFARDARELIAYRRSSLGVVRPFNVGRARVLGAELALGARWLRFLRADGAATLMDARDRSPARYLANDYLPLLPRLVVTGHVAAERTWTRGLFTELGMRVHHIASRYADPAGLVVIPAQTTWDIEAMAAFFDELVSVRAVAENLADEPTFDVVGLPQPGRRFYASLEAAW